MKAEPEGYMLLLTMRSPASGILPTSRPQHVAPLFLLQESVVTKWELLHSSYSELWRYHSGIERAPARPKSRSQSHSGRFDLVHLHSCWEKDPNGFVAAKAKGDQMKRDRFSNLVGSWEATVERIEDSQHRTDFLVKLLGQPLWRRILMLTRKAESPGSETVLFALRMAPLNMVL